MATSQTSGVIQHLRRVLRNGAGRTDEQLMEDYIRRRDEAAFAALVHRHGPMVWGVCRRVLSNYHDAEDAFQATFLVLVRRAASIASRELLANWLYGVAHRTALKARATAATRKGRETQVMNMPEPANRSQESGVRSQENADLQAVLDEELSRLPDHYRGVLVLCDLEGLTRKEAARKLRIPEGSVASRLARARVLLAKRLTQRGIVFSGGSVAAVLSAGLASASAPPALVASTIKAANLFAAGKAATAGVISARVAALTEGVVKSMCVTKIKAALTVVLILGFLGTGATLLTSRMAAGQDEKKPAVVKSLEPAAKQPKEKEKEVFTAWGMEFGGLQAGLGYHPGQMRVYHPGETVKLLVRVRNVGKQEVTFQYLRHFFIENPPVVVDDQGKVVALKDGTFKGIYEPVDITLAPGKEIDLYELSLTLSKKSNDAPKNSTLYGEGKFQLQYQRILGESSLSSVAIKCDPIHRKLATGKLDLVVKDQNNGGANQAQPKLQPAKSDKERMIGTWIITNDDSKRKGEMWFINEDYIFMNPNLTGIVTALHYHHVDASKEPRQIDITVKPVGNGPPIGIIKGIYVLDGDDLRLCLANMGKDRPAAFPKKPAPGEVLILHRTSPDTGYLNWNGGKPGAGQPKAKAEQPAVEKPKEAGPPKQQPAKTDQERMVGNWFIVNDDSKRKGEMWVISKDQILMYAKNLGANAHQYFYQLDPGKDPRQIDITVKLVNGKAIGIIKGIYVLDGDELRLCLSAMDKDRPAAFPEKPAPGEVLILQRAKPGAEQPKAKAEPPDAKKVLTPEEAIKQMPKENVTVQFKVASVEVTGRYSGYPATYYYLLKDGGKFTAWLMTRKGFNDYSPIPKLVEKLGIGSVTDLRGKVVRVTGRVEAGRMFVYDPANNIEVVKPKTDGKEQKPNEEKQPLTKEEKLRALIDQVLAAHGGEEKLKKLQFAMTVKHSNGRTNQYFIQQPNHYRWETQYPNSTTRQICILRPEGRRFWLTDPNGAVKPTHYGGVELTMDYWLDYVKFFGPRQVLRLKDADHRVTLLDEEIKIDGRAAVGVEVTYAVPNQHYTPLRKMYFDKETHLLVKLGGNLVSYQPIYYSDYKKFDGIPIAQKENDGYFNGVVTDFRAVEKFEAKLFEQP